MRRKNLWLRLSSCTMAALIATTSIVPVSAAEVDFQVTGTAGGLAGSGFLLCDGALSGGIKLDGAGILC